ncbi:MHYT domain-containing protein [Natronosporangium hydrolyticum]|nr:MHYT domain-containing protein [Natronosporangium hydrolyticum]
MAFSIAFLGSLLGLGCTARARDAGSARRRARWLALGAISIGGAGIWLMHFMAMLGFDVPAGEVRYDPGLTALSMVIAVVTVGIGLFVVGMGRRTVPRLIFGGVLTGVGVVSMHYTGMAAMRLPGEVHYDANLVAASVAIAVVAATVALWFAVSVRRGAHLAAAALLMAVAIAGMHYTGMAAVHVELTDPLAEVSGMTSMLLIVPMTVLAAGTLLATAFNALQAMTEEELDAPLPPPEPAADSAATGGGPPAPGFPPPGWRRGSAGPR